MIYYMIYVYVHIYIYNADAYIYMYYIRHIIQHQYHPISTEHSPNFGVPTAVLVHAGRPMARGDRVGIAPLARCWCRKMGKPDIKVRIS